jgi:hypothetical protein
MSPNVIFAISIAILAVFSVMDKTNWAAALCRMKIVRNAAKGVTGGITLIVTLRSDTDRSEFWSYRQTSLCKNATVWQKMAKTMQKLL